MKAFRHKKKLYSLRSISFFMIGITLLLFIGIIVSVFATNMLNMLGRHERENIRQQGNTAAGIVSASNANIQSVTRDWSSWDETYAFALGENSGYIDDIMTDYPFLLHNLNFVVIKDMENTDLYSAFYDVTAERSVPVPQGFTNYLNAIAKDMLESYDPQHAYDFNEKLGKDGFFFHDGVCYYICAMPVLTSDETSGPVGSFFFGRIYDAEEIERITGHQEINYTIIDKASPEIMGLNLKFSKNEAFSFDRDRFVYYRTFSDYFGEDNIVLRVEAPRSLFQDGMGIIVLTCAVAVLAALLMLAVIMYWMNRYLLRPLARFSADMESITVAVPSIDISGYDGNREFYALGLSINKMIGRLDQDRIAMEESTVSINVLKAILNGMDAYLYVSDIQTDEILFINDKMKEHFRLGDDAVGSICWQVLQSGLKSRCGFCPNYQLTKKPDAPVIWEEHNTATGRYYKNIDCVIEWSNGKKVHLQHSTDITDIKMTEAALNKRLKQQELMSAISQSFTTTENTQKLIHEALKGAGEFMHTNHAFLSIYRKDENDLECLYEWYDEKGKSFIESESRWPITPDMQIFEDLTVNGYAAVNDYHSLTHQNFKAVKEHDLGAFLNISIEVSGEFWGVLGFIIYEKPYSWDESDIYLGKLTAGIFSGVISRNMAEEDLLNTKQMLSAVFENAPMAIFWKDKDLVYRGVNTFFERFVGKAGDVIIGHEDAALFKPETAAQIIAFDSAFLESGKDIDIDDFQIENGKGELRWIHVNRSVIRDSRNQPSLIVGVFEDITERKKTEDELIRMSAIVSASPQYIAYVNTEGKFNFINPSTYRLTGYTHEELMEGGSQILYNQETNQKMRDEIMPAIFSQSQYSFELPLVRKDGEIRIMSFSAFVIESDQFGIGTIATDVTEQKQMERDLVKAKEAAEQASRAKGEFLSRMSHEMRTPMNAIIGMTGIARNSKDHEKKEYCLEKIDNASKHLLGVINDILDMAKIEADKFELSHAEFDLEKMLINITNVVNFRADEKKQNLVIHVDKNVPATFVGDELRLAQVITNLLTNAIKFTPEGGTIELRVHTQGKTDGAIALFAEVIDNGIGISKEKQTRLFTSFEQADGGIARKYGGTGLGLAICKKIVELMDGRIWVESELGQGAKFNFTAKMKPGKAGRLAILSNGIDKNAIRVLAVDDSPEIRDYFTHVMGSLGLSCDVADSGDAALKMIEGSAGRQYNIFFVDWMMPVIDGIELTKKIKQITRDNAVIIMISVTDWSVIQEDAIAAGVDRFISKPLFPSTLMNAINEAMGVAPEAKPMLKESNAYNFEGHTLLLVEDVEVNREIISVLLENTKVSIDSAENGMEALSMFEQNPGRYSLILMDIHMPKMDGYEAAEKIRSLAYAEAKTIPIVAMTANVFREDIEKCLQAGMNGHISKPVNTDDLFQNLNRYLAPKAGTAGNADKYVISDASKPPKASPGYGEFLPVIDVQDGLNRLMNKKALYFKLLRGFTGRQMADELIRNINDGDFTKTAQTAHALKGVSANLGLVNIMNVVSKIEVQAKAEIESTQMIAALNDTVNEAVSSITILLESEDTR